MARYTLRSASTNSWDITSGRQKVGFVKRLTDGPKAGQFSGRLGNGELVFGFSASEVFHECVAIRNRVALCGRNDRDAAVAEVRRRNAEVAREVAEANALLGPNAPIRWTVRRGRGFSL